MICRVSGFFQVMRKLRQNGILSNSFFTFSLLVSFLLVYIFFLMLISKCWEIAWKKSWEALTFLSTTKKKVYVRICLIIEWNINRLTHAKLIHNNSSFAFYTITCMLICFFWSALTYMTNTLNFISTPWKKKKPHIVDLIRIFDFS